MDKLHKYINSLSINEQIAFAIYCGTSIQYIRKIISSGGKLLFGPVICVKIESWTQGSVSRKDLRPNDWHEIWPELAKKEKQKVA